MPTGMIVEPIFVTDYEYPMLRLITAANWDTELELSKETIIQNHSAQRMHAAPLWQIPYRFFEYTSKADEEHVPKDTGRCTRPHASGKDTQIYPGKTIRPF